MDLKDDEMMSDVANEKPSTQNYAVKPRCNLQLRFSLEEKHNRDNSEIRQKWKT